MIKIDRSSHNQTENKMKTEMILQKRKKDLMERMVMILQLEMMEKRKRRITQVW